MNPLREPLWHGVRLLEAMAGSVRVQRQLQGALTVPRVQATGSHTYGLAQITIVGLNNAGKTTILYKLYVSAGPGQLP